MEKTMNINFGIETTNRQRSQPDQSTCDLLTQRMQVHEKTAWMLRRLLE
jgi:DNA-binding ferritin-like protein